jgi:hypothetical protein
VRVRIWSARINHDPYERLVSAVAAMTARGVVAGCSFDGATDTDTFVAFTAALKPALRPGDMVVMDDLAPHKAPAVQLHQALRL